MSISKHCGPNHYQKRAAREARLQQVREMVAANPALTKAAIADAFGVTAHAAAEYLRTVRLDPPSATARALTPSYWLAHYSAMPALTDGQRAVLNAWQQAAKGVAR